MPGESINIVIVKSRHNYATTALLQLEWTHRLLVASEVFLMVREANPSTDPDCQTVLPYGFESQL